MTAAARDKRRKRRLASDEAHTWARNLTLGNPHAKSVLRAIALYCNDEALCTVGIDTLALDCDVSPDTVRSRLKFLEDVGAIVRFPCWRDDLGRRNYDARGKRTTDDIRLMVDADVDGIEARARGETPDDSEPIEHASSGTESGEFSPGQQQGLNPHDDAATANRSPRLAVGQPLDSGQGLISEPEPESSPHPPSGGRLDHDDDQEKQSQIESEHFAFFKSNYPDREVWAWSKAQPIFAALKPAEQALAAAASPEYAKKIVATKRKPPPVRPERFLKDRIFDNFPHARLPEKPQAVPPRVFYPVGSEVFNGFKAAFAIARAGDFRIDWDGPVQGIWRRGEIEPGLLALAPFHDVDVERLPETAIEGSGEFAAWRDRLKPWIGFTLEARKIWTEPLDPAVHSLPFGHPEHKFRKYVNGLRVPWSFPPRKDGTISPTKSEGTE